jgi:hypothetical protein
LSGNTTTSFRNNLKNMLHYFAQKLYYSLPSTTTTLKKGTPLFVVSFIREKYNCLILLIISQSCHWIICCLIYPNKLLLRVLTRVNLTNVLDEGLMIRGRGRRMKSKVKISQTRCVLRISVVLNLAQSQSIAGRPLLAPIYRWPGLKEQVGFNTNYNIPIRYRLVFRQ